MTDGAQVVLIGNGPGQVLPIQDALCIRFNGRQQPDCTRALTVFNGKLAGAYLAKLPQAAAFYATQSTGQQNKPHSLPRVTEKWEFGRPWAAPASRHERHFALRADGADTKDMALLEGLSRVAQKQERILGAWPSSGLAVLGCLYGLAGLNVRVCQMNLLPSLIRAPELSARMPLAAAFHNWLGERRLAMDLLFDTGNDHAVIDWPDFWLPAPISQAPARWQPPSRSCPLAALTQLEHCSKTEGRKLWQQLAGMDASHWLEAFSGVPAPYNNGSGDIDSEAPTSGNNTPDLDKLIAADRLFVLPRDVQKTSLWWLYDNEVSVWVSQVHYTLAWLWQTLALRSRGLAA
ncbi:hypothetical protein OQ486_13955 [Plesiomonas shigelloides]|uniref:hypothetical protein n=1 Tax=Plesiomonas shigelloides TaxID=703 RepID=UPI002245C518|nr:hypothetical protein [Plesiomonas shigelloides]MCX2497897.1 hypothetical protein [Plesiomonas shigelloides]MCX2534561.1 hypothetical protein [Plesiomonas shigelloides]